MRDAGWTFFKKLLDCPCHEARNEGGCPSCNIRKFPIGSMDLDTGKLQYLFSFQVVPFSNIKCAIPVVD